MQSKVQNQNRRETAIELSTYMLEVAKDPTNDYFDHIRIGQSLVISNSNQDIYHVENDALLEKLKQEVQPAVEAVEKTGMYDDEIIEREFAGKPYLDDNDGTFGRRLRELDHYELEL